MNFNIENDIEELIFPEILHNNKLRNLINLKKESEITKEEKSSFIKITDEIIKKNKVVRESFWFESALEKNIYNIVESVENSRIIKKNKKQIEKIKLKDQKEKKFNKTYDNSDLPRDKRKMAYNHFVLNENIYQKEIKVNNIEKYINGIETFNHKLKIKKIRKLSKELAEKSDFIDSDYELKVLKNIVLKRFSLDREIIVFKYSDFDCNYKDFNVFKSNVEEKLKNDIDFLEKKEKKSLIKKLSYIENNINLKNIDNDIIKDSFLEVVNIYNYNEMLEEFIFNIFMNYSKKSNVFSDKQNEVFKLRKKFRNRVIVNFEGREFETCYYFKYEKIERHFKELIISLDRKLDNDYFNSFLKILNDKFISNKWDKNNIDINFFVKDLYFKILQKNKPYKSILKESSLYQDIIDLTVKYLSREPENRRLEISKERLQEIFNGQKNNYFNLAIRAIAKSKIDIDYKNQYPLARNMKRHIKFFVGKTNSGKTYKSFNELLKYNSGVYLSPLRLLALEGQTEMNKRNVKCSMITGEEKIIQEGANFISSTIEMVNLKNEVDCAIIDEIQMLADEDRGWAWTQALIGMPAKNIILTGSEQILDLVKSLIEYTGDTLDIEYLERKSPLKVLDKVSDISNLEKGTAIVAFSRNDVLSLKNELKDRKVSVIYGNLGPDVRRKEAESFRCGKTDILIATDAIAMGLNLPIEKILFFKHTKKVRGEKIEISDQLIHQIGGRAGRYGLKNIGYVGSLNNSTLSFIRKSLLNPIPKYEGKSFIMPNLANIKDIKETLKIDKFSECLIIFKNLLEDKDIIFESTNIEKMIEISKEIEHYMLSDELMMKLSSAPIRENNENGLYLFNKFVSISVENDYIGDNKKYIWCPKIDAFKMIEKTDNSETLKNAEELVHEIDLYLWFSNIYPSYFNEVDTANNNRKILNKFIEKSIEQV